MRPRKPPLVLVEWIDPWSLGGWTEKEQALREVEEHDMTCWTVGYVIAETKEYLAIAGSITAAKSPQLGDVFKLPHAVIVKRTPLKA